MLTSAELAAVIGSLTSISVEPTAEFVIMSCTGKTCGNPAGEGREGGDNTNNCRDKFFHLYAQLSLCKQITTTGAEGSVKSSPLLFPLILVFSAKMFVQLTLERLSITKITVDMRL